MKKECWTCADVRHRREQILREQTISEDDTLRCLHERQKVVQQVQDQLNKSMKKLTEMKNAWRDTAVQAIVNEVIEAIELNRKSGETSASEQSEVKEIVTTPELILTFGKYKGIHVTRVEEIDAHYIVWLAGYTG